jgi:hypothetical protein
MIAGVQHLMLCQPEIVLLPVRGEKCITVISIDAKEKRSPF